MTQSRGRRVPTLRLFLMKLDIAQSGITSSRHSKFVVDFIAIWPSRTGPVDLHLHSNFANCTQALLLFVVSSSHRYSTMSFGRPGGLGEAFRVNPPERGSFPLDHEGGYCLRLLYCPARRTWLCLHLAHWDKRPVHMGARRHRNMYEEEYANPRRMQEHNAGPSEMLERSKGRCRKMSAGIQKISRV